MKIAVSQSHAVSILEMEGKITIGEGDVMLRETIHDLMRQGHRKILLDMAHISYMDSSGVGELLACYQHVANQGGHMKLLNLSTKIKDLLQVTQLLSVFEYFDDEMRAINSFA